MSKEKQIHNALIEKEKTLAFAESLTGGHLAGRFTSIPDASLYFLGSLITYSDGLKEKLLSVDPETLRNHGAVSRETAHEMWIGLMKETGADYGVSTTGIAGPTGGSKEKPVGTVFLAVGEAGKKPHVVECHFDGDREAVIAATCARISDELLSTLKA